MDPTGSQEKVKGLIESPGNFVGLRSQANRLQTSKYTKMPLAPEEQDIHSFEILKV